MRSPKKLKQIKITGYCVKSPEVGKVRVNRKRKNSGDDAEEKRKKLAFVDSENVFDDFLDDFFASPRKESPKKSVLGSNGADWEAGLDFGSPKKCKVTRTRFDGGSNFEQVLTVQDEKTSKEGTCRLRDAWTCHEFAIDDVVSILATKSEGSWIVDNKTGYVILHPDMIVSSTVLARSMFCMRQGILSYFFKESGTEGSRRMLVGRLIHELFQKTLKNRGDFGESIESLLTARENLRDILFSDVNVCDIRKEMEGYVPEIERFLGIYVDGRMKPEGKNFNGSIEDVLDIEEVVKSPLLGLQGRVDVTVRIKSGNRESVAPLELKTGRASFSQEHRSQLTLYVLLMQELGRKVDAGLLLYLKDGLLEEIKPQRDEIRNLFLLRNHFVGYCKDMKVEKLPEPIRYIKNCDKCGYVRVCKSYLKDENQPVGRIVIPDMKPSHVEYFLKWSRLLFLENEGGSTDIRGLKIQPTREDFRYSFIIKWSGKTPRCGTFVYIQNGKCERVSAGQIIEVTETRIDVLTEKKINDHLDSYTIVIPGGRFLSFYLSNLGWLLEEKHERLREIIIERKLPSFEKNINKREFTEKCLSELVKLNKDQQKAVLKGLMCKDYLLIKGPPGTGKTQTVVSLIKILLAVGKKVLLAGHTHSSIDNVLLRLTNVEYLRLGSFKNIHERVYNNSYEKLINDCRHVDDLRKVFDRKLIASTCMGIDGDFVEKYKVDVCIVDESSQVLQPEVLRPLFCSGKFILVGDDDQLPPIVRNPEAKKQGMDKSLFEQLTSDRATVKLRLQYRMNHVINSLANAIAYDGTIECANEKIARATIKTPKIDTEWIARALSDDLDKSITFIDTSNYFRSKSSKGKVERCSSLEVNIIVKLVKCLLGFLKNDSIGVVTPFWDQVVLLKKKLTEGKLEGIELNTVDQYQGRDKDVILFSCSKENDRDRETTEMELLNDKRRLTVAVTRAKYKLIIVGDRQTLVKYKPFDKLIQSLRDSQFLVLSDGEKDFFWKDYVD